RRQQRSYIVDKKGGNDHTTDGAQEKVSAQQPVTQKRQRHIQEQNGDTDRHSQQTVKDHGNAGKTGQRKLSVDRKAVDRYRYQKSAQCFNQKRDDLLVDTLAPWVV